MLSITTNQDYIDKRATESTTLASNQTQEQSTLLMEVYCILYNSLNWYLKLSI